MKKRAKRSRATTKRTGNAGKANRARSLDLANISQVLKHMRSTSEEDRVLVAAYVMKYVDGNQPITVFTLKRALLRNGYHFLGVRRALAGLLRSRPQLLYRLRKRSDGYDITIPGLDRVDALVDSCRP